jgi:hypothetical protein
LKTFLLLIFTTLTHPANAQRDSLVSIASLNRQSISLSDINPDDYTILELDSLDRSRGRKPILQVTNAVIDSALK